MTAETMASSGAPATGLGPWMRFRRQYSRLSPPVQMIGLQLWLPLVFVIAFCLCYINAFHQPTPKDIKVAVVGTGPAAATLADRLEGTSNGMLSVSMAGSVDAARSDVRDGDLAAAFTPGAANQPARLLIASGAQFQLAEVVQQTFAPVAAAEGTTLAVDDLAPLPKHDSYGTSGFYLALVWTIAGYMVGMFIGMMGQTLKHHVRLGLIVGSGFVFSLLGTLFAGPVVGAVHGHFLSLWLLGWLTTISVGLVVNGLSYFIGRFVTGAALILFVFLNIPASGGAFPAAFVPEPFKWLHPYVFGTGVLDVLRGIVYDAGPGIGRGATVIGVYAAVGIVLTAVGRPFFNRRTRLRAERGKPVSMMLAAQGAAMAARQAEQAEAAAGTRPHHVTTSDAPASDAPASGAPASGATTNGVTTNAGPRRDGESRDNEFADEEVESDAAAVSGAAAGSGSA
ncbi:ABC-2 family transporter protein [Frankia torreyi]|uniref:ABC-2 family transporter protein n=1 Tax=Frankia torreyi TaxID=1856 RepID=A0A0D8BHE3_9ACTN|nr:MULTISPECIES: ABC transporter permease [Frankia]KJE23485.1 ABC-2 family transporter protein [Frankia torreyi]